MRTQSWCWGCELCGHIWLAVGIEPPEKCAKCKKRGWHAKGISEHLANPVAAQAELKAVTVPAPAKVSMDALRAICAGKLPPSKDKVIAPVQSEPVELCRYTEYDPETGQTYSCRLPVHPAKIQHQRGHAL